MSSQYLDLDFETKVQTDIKFVKRCLFVNFAFLIIILFFVIYSVIPITIIEQNIQAAGNDIQTLCHNLGFNCTLNF